MSVLRSSIEIANLLLGKVRERRKVTVPKNVDSVRLNLGCGLAVTNGWINVDGSPNALLASLPKSFHKFCYRLTGANRYYSEEEYCKILGSHIFVHHDLSKSIPFEDGVAHYVFSSHFFEHLYYKEAIEFLRECYRVMMPGAVIRIAIPDLEYALSLYSEDKKEQMLKDYFFIEDESNKYSRHKYMYDYSMLESLMREVGFKEIVRLGYREGNMPDIDVLDNRPAETLFVESIK